MIYTFKSSVRWRRDRTAIFICDCKRLLDFQLPHCYMQLMETLGRGVEPDTLSPDERRAFGDMEKTGLLSVTGLIKNPQNKIRHPSA